MQTHSLRVVSLVSFLGLLSPLTAGEYPGGTPVPSKNEISPLDQLWGLATLYKNDANPFIEEFKLRGRYQGQYHWLDSEQGNDRDWENRRSRFGFDARLFKKQFEVRLDAQSSEEFNPFYDRLVDAYLKWKPSSQFSLTLGKQKPLIGYYDWLQSTNSQPTFERSQIFNQLKVDRATGATAEGRVGNFSWQLGAYFNDADREFGKFQGGISLGGGIGYDFKEALSLDRADWRLDWIHSQHENGDTVFNRYDDLISTTFWLKQDRWGLVTEAFLGTGESPTAFGFYIQPSFDLLPQKIQLVGRLSVSWGDGPDSLSAQTRYEKSAPDLSGSGRGESYQSAYVGLQYFLHGDNLKFLAGTEYSHLSGGGNGGDYKGWTALAGIRFSF